MNDEEPRADAEIRNIFATVGGGSRQEPNRASIYVQISGKQEREFTQNDFVAGLRPRLVEQLTEAEEVTVSPIGWVSGDGFSRKAVTYSLQGPELNVLEGYAEQLLAR